MLIFPKPEAAKGGWSYKQERYYIVTKVFIVMCKLWGLWNLCPQYSKNTVDQKGICPRTDLAKILTYPQIHILALFHAYGDTLNINPCTFTYLIIELNYSTPNTLRLPAYLIADCVA